jgi:hypothetical protein
MRVYKLGKLLEYHASTLPKTEGDMHALSTERIEFWRTVLDSFLADTTLGEEVISTYKQSRDRLRSGDEKKRQEALH